MIKVELGGGHRPQPGYINVDTRQLPTVDIVPKNGRLPFEAESIDEILTICMLEHLTIAEAVSMFAECSRIMKEDASLIICLPVMDRIVGHWKGRERQACEHGFGTDDWPGNAHKTFWTSVSVLTFLQELGFTVTEEPYEFPIHQRDWMIQVRAIKQEKEEKHD